MGRGRCGATESDPRPLRRDRAPRAQAGRFVRPGDAAPGGRRRRRKRGDARRRNASWGHVTAGPWLAEALAACRSPETLAAVRPGEALKATLRPYQDVGLRWLGFLARLGLGACLADDMGLGKTIQVLALLLTVARSRRRAAAEPHRRAGFAARQLGGRGRAFRARRSTCSSPIPPSPRPNG